LDNDSFFSDNDVIEFIGRKPDGLALWMNADIFYIIQSYKKVFNQQRITS